MGPPRGVRNKPALAHLWAMRVESALSAPQLFTRHVVEAFQWMLSVHHKASEDLRERPKGAGARLDRVFGRCSRSFSGSGGSRVSPLKQRCYGIMHMA